ncbi:MAG: hypothetical protein ACLFST_06305 [Spirochaetia bacterium]
MKLTKKNSGPLTLLIILSMVVCTLAWYIIERISAAAGAPFSLSVGPIGFDIGVLAVHLRVNPGTIIGLPCGYFVFKSL